MVVSKQRDSRVLKVDLTLNIEPPESGGGKKLKSYPYPSEFLQVVGSPAIPLEFRELHTLAVFTYTRPSELFALEWPDIDIDNRAIHITKAIEWTTGEIKDETKTYESLRDIPIHENLVPLLTIMKARAGGVGRIFPIERWLPELKPLAETTREHFQLAGCTRARLFSKKKKTEVSVRFRSWRDAGATWAIVSGVSEIVVERRLGHTNPKTMRRYVVEAENRSPLFGVPFPPLPESFLEAARGVAKRSA